MSDCVALELAGLLESKVLSGIAVQKDKEEAAKIEELINTFKSIGEANKAKAAEVATKTTPKEVEYESINVYWGSNENKELSNLHPRKFTYEGKEYKSVEHAYQTLKSGSFDSKVYSADWSKGGLVARGKAAKTEGDYNIKLMYVMMLVSFESNEDAADALIATLEKDITHTEGTGIWKDKFPELLEKVRDTLNQQTAFDSFFYGSSDYEGGNAEKAANEGYKSPTLTYSERRELLKEQVKKMNPGIDLAKYDQEFNDITGAFQMKGEELKNDAPEIFEAIKNKLKETYPAINVSAVDKIIGTEGLPALGRALKGAVEYVPNEAGLDTLPHEYAHIYIDLLEGTPLVEKVLKEVEKRENLSRKDAKEHLVNIMGKNYVKYLKNEKKIDLEKEGKDNDVSMAQLLWRMVKKYLGIGVSAKEFAYDLDTLSGYFCEGNNADAIRFSPKEGFEKVNTEATFKDNMLASELLTYIIDKSNDTAAFTGSAALAMQGVVYRKGANGITDLHDLDIEVRSEDVSSLRKNLEKDYNGVSIYEFPIVKNKELAALVNYLEKRIKKDASTKMILGIGKLFIRSNKVSTLIVPPKGLTVDNLKRHGGKGYGRVVSYDLTDSTGSIKGSYKAELSEVPGSKRTTIKKEIFNGDKAVIVDLLGSEEKALGKKVKVFSETLKTYINVSAAEAIFDAKNDIGGFFPRDKDVMDRVFFYKGSDYGLDSNFMAELKKDPKSVIYNESESGRIEAINLIMSSRDC